MTTTDDPAVAPPRGDGAPGRREGRVAVGLERRAVLRALAVAVVILVAGLFVPDLITSSYYMGVAADGVVLGIMAAGIGFLAHRSGLISLGHTAFYGGSAYGVAIFTTHWGWSPTTAAVVAVIGGTLLAVAIGSLVIRITGFGFLMLTLAFGQALYALSTLTSLRDVTGAFDGISVVFSGESQKVAGLTQAQLGAPDTFWPLAWVCLVLVVLGLWLVGRSRFGVTLEAIRENEERARFSGYNTYLPRLGAFAISGFCASIAGVLFALKASYVSPDVLGFQLAGDSLVATIVGGFTILIGPVVGALLYIYAQGRFGDTGNLELYMGLALIVVVIFLPGGVVGFVTDRVVRLRARLWRGRKGAGS
ncbi:branched-chain amino acid ABC transporter permease [Baekduia sp.]|uniref:branched-chain amino acid ABC transporter permease n=1 Tax=Baekduia sp. TaxID=2600305 RepID=UPI002D78F0E3|nr:branched-chain amino acid ABC transporter permease [Baekduia sp.]